jgi:S1-C subfamily serine protease
VDTSDIGSIMEKHQPGDVVTMTVYRGRKKMMLKVTLGDAHEVNT